MVRRTGARARPPPSPSRVRDRPTTPHDRRAARSLARGLRPEWTNFPIARLRYTATDKSWTLYWRDRNLRFHIYDLLAPSNRVDDLLTELDRDPTGIFWG